MYISDLNLQGFKSFANKAHLKFDSGLTSVVGPNGCGKSNIVDALRWVLGEQRPTQLRSANMSNVIFNGTANKKPLGLAEVSLTFVNNRGVLPTEYDEVTITRRLYRSGESEYLINNTECRLKDIMELFMDTGMGANAYSVIELKMVEEILDDKNNDRRHLFEEAAGVTKYKDQRKRTHRKLEDTRANVQRLEDLLVEVRKKVRSLKTQAERARRAKQYRDELTTLDQAITFKEHKQQQDDLQPLQERIKNITQEKKKLQERVEKQENELEEARNNLHEIEKEQSEAQRKQTQISNNIQEINTEIQVTREKVNNENSRVESSQKEIEQLKKDLEELEGIRQQHESQLETKNQEQEKTEKRLEEAKKQYEELRSSVQQTKEQRKNYQNQINQARQQVQKLESRKVRIESTLENRAEDEERVQKDIEDSQATIQELQEQQQETKEELDKANQKFEEHNKKVEDTRQKQKELQQQRDEVKEEIRSAKSRLDALQSEREMLEGIGQSHEAFPNAVRYVLEERQDLRDHIQVLSDGLSTQPEWAVALERVLGDAAHYMVVDTQDTARSILNILKEEEQGQAGIIPLDHWSAVELPQPQQDSLYHKVESPERLEPLKRLFLSNVLVADSVEAAYEQVRTSDYSIASVTRDGDVVTREGILRGGSAHQHLGVRTGLKARIEDIDSQIAEAQNEQSRLEQKLGEIGEQIENLDIQEHQKQLEEARKHVQQLRQKQGNQSSNLDIYQKNLNQQKNRLEELESEHERLKEEQVNLDPQIQEEQDKLADLEHKEAEAAKEQERLEEKLATAQERYNDASREHLQLKNTVDNLEKELKRATRGIKEKRQKQEQLQKQISESRENVEKWNQHISQKEKERNEAQQQKKEVDTNLEGFEEKASHKRGLINQIEKDLKDIRKKRDTNADLLNNLEITKNKLEIQVKQSKDHIWENYGLMMDQIAQEFPDEEMDMDAAYDRLANLRQKLNNMGEVNALAVDEYEEEKERLEFYEEQLEDLREAEEDLLQSIEEINREANERFNKTFELIKENFQQVFHTLFEEDDECDLVMNQNPEDPLDAKIEIIANPRGKRPTNINQLSGGEKTLTAIALLFAIYLVKPSPFCVLDEVDAPLDDANIDRFVNMLKSFSDKTQFIIITHNKKTMSNAEMLYGVTMPENGVSQLVGVKLDEINSVTS